ncbi:MAG: metalloregulator ArsR/SmtB family transcription factor [Verrucomicrobiota bacterium]
MAKDVEQLATQLWAIGDATRLKILQMLPDTADCESSKNVSQLAEKLNLSQPTVSHHLRVLRQAGIVSHKKACRDCYYWVDRDAASDVIERLDCLLGVSSPSVAD